MSKYGVGNVPTLAAPTISPSQGVYSGSTPITLTSGDSNSLIYYTTNGSTPTTSSSLYTGPFYLSSSATVKAIAWQAPPFYNASGVSSAYIQIDPTTANVPRTNLNLWLKADNGVQTSGSNVTGWTDMSGAGNNFTQSNSSNQPTFVSNAVNSQPAIAFSGSSQYVQGHPVRLTFLMEAAAPAYS